MVHHPSVYAELLRQKMAKHGCNCWLVNTGWTGGSFGIGKRISIRHTRNLLNAALDGKLKDVKYRKDKLFLRCPEVAEVPGVLDPSSTGQQDEYWKVRRLAADHPAGAVEDAVTPDLPVGVAVAILARPPAPPWQAAFSHQPREHFRPCHEGCQVPVLCVVTAPFSHQPSAFWRDGFDPASRGSQEQVVAVNDSFYEAGVVKG
jgi:hypothetical protein